MECIDWFIWTGKEKKASRATQGFQVKLVDPLNGQ